VTADLRAQRDLGKIIGDAYRIYASNFRALFLIALVVAPWQILVTVVVRRIDDAATAQIAGLYLQIPGAIIALIASGGIIRAMRDLAEGSTPGAGPSIDTGLQKFWPTFPADLIIGMRIVAALFAVPFLSVYWLFDRGATIDGRRDWYFALVPFALCIYLAIRWGFVQNAVVMHDKRSWEAIDDSAGVVRGQWWRVFGITIVIGLFRLAPSIVAGFTAYAPPLADGAAVALASALVLPLGVVAQTLLYYDLKARSSVDLSPARIGAP
jgi:hypothetical protein